VHEVYRQIARFHAQPLDEKLKIKLDKDNVGYLQMMGDTLRTSVVGERNDDLAAGQNPGPTDRD
jgi:hypothetical protein